MIMVRSLISSLSSLLLITIIVIVVCIVLLLCVSRHRFPAERGRALRRAAARDVDSGNIDNDRYRQIDNDSG